MMQAWAVHFFWSAAVELRLLGSLAVWRCSHNRIGEVGCETCLAWCNQRQRQALCTCLMSRSPVPGC